MQGGLGNFGVVCACAWPGLEGEEGRGGEERTLIITEDSWRSSLGTRTWCVGLKCTYDRQATTYTLALG